MPLKISCLIITMKMKLKKKLYHCWTYKNMSSKYVQQDRLKSPNASDLARKRKVQSNPPVGMKKSKKGRNSAFAPKSISIRPCDEAPCRASLFGTTGTLFCSACREQLSVKSQVIKLHIKRLHSNIRDNAVQL